MEENIKGIIIEFIPQVLGEQIVIPIYHRPYIWTVENALTQLMDNLKELIGSEASEKQHCLGIMYYYDDLVNYKTKTFIADGQQRLITMFLMAQAIKSVAPTEFEKRRIDQAYLQNSLGKDEAKYQQRLHISRADNEDYLLVANEKYDELDEKSNSNIVKNFLFLQKEFKELLMEYSFEQLFYALKKFSIIAIKLGDNQNPQQIYEDINYTCHKKQANRNLSRG